MLVNLLVVHSIAKSIHHPQLWEQWMSGRSTWPLDSQIFKLLTWTQKRSLRKLYSAPVQLRYNNYTQLYTVNNILIRIMPIINLLCHVVVPI